MTIFNSYFYFYKEKGRKKQTRMASLFCDEKGDICTNWELYGTCDTQWCIMQHPIGIISTPCPSWYTSGIYTNNATCELHEQGKCAYYHPEHISEEEGFIFSCKKGYIDIVKSLNEKNRFNKKIIRKGLGFAIMRGHIDIAKYFYNECGLYKRSPIRNMQMQFSSLSIEQQDEESFDSFIRDNPFAINYVFYKYFIYLLENR